MYKKTMNANPNRKTGQCQKKRVIDQRKPQRSLRTARPRAAAPPMMLTIVESALLDLEVVLAVGEGAPDDVRVTPCVTVHQQLGSQGRYTEGTYG
jgi:hypothetical protein